MRAREIEEEIKNRGFERGVVYVLSALAEQNNQNKRDIREMAVMLDKVIDMSGGIMAVAENMKGALEGFGSDMREPSLGASTQHMGDPDEDT